MKQKVVLGIDFGGSGIKGAPVDLETGNLLEERVRIETPEKSTPKAVAQVINDILDKFKWKGPVGMGFPAVVQNGIVKTAANIDKGWIGTNAQTLFQEKTGCQFLVLNDADVAGMAEMKYGAGKGNKGVVVLLTIGTGIGTVLFTKRKLVPNMEFGHLYLPSGNEAEEYCSDATRKKLDLSWTDWAKRFNEYLTFMEFLLSPDLFIIGGGVSKKMDKFMEYIKINSQIVPAILKNEAGIVGAALSAYKAYLKE